MLTASMKDDLIQALLVLLENGKMKLDLVGLAMRFAVTTVEKKESRTEKAMDNMVTIQ